MDAVLEPVVDPVGDEAFEGEDAFIETLSLQYAGDAFTVYAGKINPVFGSAADVAPGLYGVEAGEAYQITETLGVGGDISLSSNYSTLKASMFFRRPCSLPIAMFLSGARLAACVKN